jgi:hypothetical protein
MRQDNGSLFVVFLFLATVGVWVMNLIKFIGDCTAPVINWGITILHGIGVFSGVFSWVSVWFN